MFILTTWLQHKANPCHMEPKLHRVRVNKVFCSQRVSIERKGSLKHVNMFRGVI